jgi:hypothetical protein
LISLQTTPDGVDGCPRLSIDGHVPDMRSFWSMPEPKKYADRVRFEVRQQKEAIAEGVYLMFFTCALDGLPENCNFPEYAVGDRFLHGDIFVVKLKPWEFGLNGWAEYDDVPAAFLRLPSMQGKRRRRSKPN